MGGQPGLGRDQAHPRAAQHVLPPNVYGCFFKDNTGIELRERIGIDRITFETDYPHTDSTWPHSRAIVAKLLDGLDAESIHKIVRGNAIDLFELQGFQ